MATKKKSLLFSLSCGCRGSKSLSIKPTSETLQKTDNHKTENLPAAKRNEEDIQPSVSSAETEISLTSWSKEDCSLSVTSEDFSRKSVSSFSGLLRQLNELERNLVSLTGKIPVKSPATEDSGLVDRDRHSRSKSEGRIDESVAVVKNSDDPLTDFRWSMLQMIVEKEIVGAEELRELLHRFLSLNSPEHHDVILRAFVEIWNEVFSRDSYQNTPDFFVK